MAMVRLGSLLALAVSLSMPAVSLAASTSGRLLASQCAQCHGTDGHAVGDIDRLAGESVAEMLDELLEMKYSPRQDKLMHRQARGYSDNQLRLIAEYYAALDGGDGGDGGDDDEKDEDDRDRDKKKDKEKEKEKDKKKTEDRSKKTSKR
jgi:sulfide dehydrogenase cytochrome subunit